MKAKIFIMCAVIGLALGCAKETEHADRYKVFPASWETSITVTMPDGKLNSNTVSQKALLKLDSATGRVWFWRSAIQDTNNLSGWVKMTDSGYVFLTPQRTTTH